MLAVKLDQEAAFIGDAKVMGSRQVMIIIPFERLYFLVMCGAFRQPVFLPFPFVHLLLFGRGFAVIKLRLFITSLCLWFFTFFLVHYLLIHLYFFTTRFHLDVWDLGGQPTLVTRHTTVFSFRLIIISTFEEMTNKCYR